jgi:hypothetical protein
MRWVTGLLLLSACLFERPEPVDGSPWYVTLRGEFDIDALEPPAEGLPPVAVTVTLARAADEGGADLTRVGTRHQMQHRSRGAMPRPRIHHALYVKDDGLALQPWLDAWGRSVVEASGRTVSDDGEPLTITVRRLWAEGDCHLYMEADATLGERSWSGSGKASCTQGNPLRAFDAVARRTADELPAWLAARE